MVRCSSLLVVLFLSLLPRPTGAQPAPPPAEWTGESADNVFGLMTVWGSVKYAFPHGDRLEAIDWDQAVRDCVPRVLDAKDIEDYYAVLMELVARLGDSHTMVLPPWGRMKPGYDIAPLEIAAIDGRFYVARVGARPWLAEAGVVPGVEIVSVDGVATAQCFEDSVLRYHSWGAAHANAAGLMVYLLYGPANGSNTVEFRTAAGSLSEVAIPRDALSGTPTFMTKQLENAFAGPTIRTQMLPDGILYAEIPNFEHERVRVDFEALIDTLETDSVRGMIIDLRFNMGGSSAVSEPMVACMIDEMVHTPTMKFRNYSGARAAWGQDPQWETRVGEVQPRQGRRYRGPLIVLVGNLTNSTAEDFALELRAARRARLVGQRTAGGAGNALTSPLPAGGTLYVSTFTALTQDGEEYVGRGIEPDLPVQVTPEDLAAGRDPVLDRAVALLSAH
jgi:carboxyl-terminal processing protease